MVAIDLRVAEDGLEFRAEVEIAAAASVVEGLDSHAIAGQHEALPGFAPDGEGEHTAKLFDAGSVPLDEGPQDDFGITGGLELVAVVDKFSA